MDNKELKRAGVRADRQRTYRRRAAAGKIIVPIEIDEIETAQLLVDGEFLATENCENREAIAAAIEALIAGLIAAARDA